MTISVLQWARVAVKHCFMQLVLSAMLILKKIPANTHRVQNIWSSSSSGRCFTARCHVHACGSGFDLTRYRFSCTKWVFKFNVWEFWLISSYKLTIFKPIKACSSQLIAFVKSYSSGCSALPHFGRSAKRNHWIQNDAAIQHWTNFTVRAQRCWHYLYYGIISKTNFVANRIEHIKPLCYVGRPSIPTTYRPKLHIHRKPWCSKHQTIFFAGEWWCWKTWSNHLHLQDFEKDKHQRHCVLSSKCIHFIIK